MFTSVKAYIYGGIAILFVALATYCYILHRENNDLLTKVGSLQAIAVQKQDAAKQCSDSVDQLKSEQEKMDSAAKIALDEAKKKASIYYTKYQATLIRKPVVPIITEKNVQYFGPKEDAKKIEDYNATHELLNEEIDARTAK